jgi:hypothetical protein
LRYYRHRSKKNHNNNNIGGMLGIWSRFPLLLLSSAGRKRPSASVMQCNIQTGADKMMHKQEESEATISHHHLRAATFFFQLLLLLLRHAAS